jgi:putative transposase
MPQSVSVAVGEIVADVREGLLAIAVGTGLQVMAAMMDAEVAAVCGPKGKHDPSRTAVRHGTERGSVILGGRAGCSSSSCGCALPTVRASCRWRRTSYSPARRCSAGWPMAKMLAGISTRR